MPHPGTYLSKAFRGSLCPRKISAKSLIAASCLARSDGPLALRSQFPVGGFGDAVVVATEDKIAMERGNAAVRRIVV